MFKNKELKLGLVFIFIISMFLNISSIASAAVTLPPLGTVTVTTDTYSINLSWEQPNIPNFDSVRVQRDPGGLTLGWVTTNSYTDTGLEYDKDYTYTLMVRDKNGDVSPLKRVNTHTATGNVQNPRLDYIQNSWNSNNLNIGAPPDLKFDHFNIYRDGVLIATTKSSTYLDADGILPNTVYIYKVTTVTTEGKESTGRSLTVKTTSKPETIPPQEVTGVVYSSIGLNSFTISWVNPSDTDFDRVNIYNSNALVKTVSKDVYSYTFINLQPETDYDIALKTVDRGNNESTGTHYTVSTLGVAPAEITNISAVSDYTSIILDWTNPADADFDKVIVYMNDNLLGETTTGNFQATGLTEGTSYSFKLVTVDKKGNQSNGVNKTYTTLVHNTNTSSGSVGGYYAPTTLAATADGSTTKAVPVSYQDASGGIITINTADAIITIPANSDVGKILVTTNDKIVLSDNFVTGSKVVSIEFIGKDGNPLSGDVRTKVEIPVKSDNKLISNVYEVQPDGTLKIVDSVTTTDGKIVQNALEGRQYVVATYSRKFVDITSTMWSANDIQLLAAKQIVDGYNDGTFRPNNEVTRAEFLAMAMRVLSYNLEPSGKGTVFEDVKSGDWYSGIIEKAYENGIVSGDSEGKFEPNREITKEEMIAIVVRLLEEMRGKIDASNNNVKFTDANNIDSWAKNSIVKAEQVGLVDGNDQNQLEPDKTGSRAEAATLISKLFKMVNVES
jgi:hypothetical protein